MEQMKPYWPGLTGIDPRYLELNNSANHDDDNPTSLQASQPRSNGTQSGDDSWPHVPAWTEPLTQIAPTEAHLEMDTLDADIPAHGDFQFNNIVEMPSSCPATGIRLSQILRFELVENNDTWFLQDDEEYWKTAQLTPIIGLSSQQTLSPFMYTSLEQNSNERLQFCNQDIIPLLDPPLGKTQVCQAAGLVQTLDGSPRRPRRIRRSRRCSVRPSASSREVSSPMLDSHRYVSLQKAGPPLSNTLDQRSGQAG
jgi:hypothetical protein